VFERLNRSSFAGMSDLSFNCIFNCHQLFHHSVVSGIHAELTEVFDQFEKEVRRAKAAESD
jgi:hypothetical protein